MKNSSPLFDHFLITRFNLRKKEWTTNKNNSPVLTEEWHSNRMRLFETYCLPSVEGQQNTNFKWLVYFDTTTPTAVKERITYLSSKFSLFKPLFCNGMDNFLPSIERDLASCEKPFIITSRLDNDDCIASNFIDTVQQSFNSQEYIALDFVKGWTLSIDAPCKLGIKVQAYNPFMSLIEKNNQPKTIWSKGHTEWKSEKRVLQNITDLIWMSVIHNENKINDFTGFGSCDIDQTLSNFTIPEKEKDRIKDEHLKASRWMASNFMNRLDSYYKYYSKELKKKLNLYSKP
jgi:hypothetical protein